MTILAITFLVGLALIIVSILGGGLEVKEVKIPTLPAIPRAMSFVAGTALVVACFAFPDIFSKFGPHEPSKPTPAPTNVQKEVKTERHPGAAIVNGLITVREVKIVLRRLKVYDGPIDDVLSDSHFQAVATFQLSQKIDADGMVGPVTYGKLREAWPDFFERK